MGERSETTKRTEETPEGSLDHDETATILEEVAEGDGWADYPGVVVVYTRPTEPNLHTAHNSTFTHLPLACESETCVHTFFSSVS